MLSRPRAILGIGLTIGIAALFWPGAILSFKLNTYNGAGAAKPVILISAGVMLLAWLLSPLLNPARARRAAAVLTALTFLFVATAALTSRTFFQVAAAVLILLAALGIGITVLRWFGHETQWSLLERAALSVGLGLGILSHVVLVLGLLHLLYPAAGFALLGVALAATYKRLWEILRETWSLAGRGIGSHLVILAVVLAFVAIVALQAMAPAIQYDDLHYHLYIPQQYVASHRLMLFPDVYQSFFYQGEEMLYTLGFLVGGENTAIFLNASFGILIALALAGFAGRVYSAGAAWLSLLIWISTPIVDWLMTTGITDLASALFAFLMVVASYAYARAPDRRTAALAGALAGFAVSIKLNTAMFVLALMATMIVWCWLRKSRWESIRFVAACSIGGIVTGCVWPLLRFVQTGNPTYPFLNGIFKAPGIPAENAWMNLAMFGTGKTLASLAALPWNLSFHGSHFMEALHPYVLGPCLLLAVTGFFAAWPGTKRETGWSIAIVLIFLGMWFLSTQYMRYLAPGLPMLALLGGVAVDRIASAFHNRSRQILIGLFGIAVACPSLVLWLASYYNIPERVPLSVIFGREPAEFYLARAVGVYPALSAAGSACFQPSGGVLVLQNEFEYLCPQMVSSWAPRAIFVYEAGSDEFYLEHLKQLHIRYVAVDSAAAPEKLPFYSSGFLDRAGELIYSGTGGLTYKLDRPLISSAHPAIRTMVADEEKVDQPYVPGLLSSMDPGFENSDSKDSPWNAVPVVTGSVDSGFNPKAYQPAREGKQALYIGVAGPSTPAGQNLAMVAFPKVDVPVKAENIYEFSFDLLCSGLLETPQLRLHVAGSDGKEVSSIGIVSAGSCDSTWRRYRARWTVPPGGVRFYPEFGFTYSRPFQYARYMEVDRLGLTAIAGQEVK